MQIMKEERKKMMGNLWNHGPSLPYPLVLCKQGQVEDLELNSPEANGNSPSALPPSAKRRQSKCGLYKAQPCRGYFPKIQLLKPAEWNIAAWRFSLAQNWTWPVPCWKPPCFMAFLSCLCPTKHSINSDPESRSKLHLERSNLSILSLVWFCWMNPSECVWKWVSDTLSQTIVFGVLSSHH